MLTRFSAVLAVSLSLYNLSFAATATTTAALIGPSQVAEGVEAGQGSNGYSYQGCYNETTGIPGTNGARALANGNMVRTAAIRPCYLTQTNVLDDTERTQYPNNPILPLLLRRKQLPILRSRVRPRVLGRALPEHLLPLGQFLPLQLCLPGQLQRGLWW